MTTKDKVEFYKYSQSEYDNTTKSANSLYFTTDTHRIYKGDNLYGTAEQSDWNVNDDTSPAYIKNREFYTDKVVVNYRIFDNFVGEDIYLFSPALGLQIGETYQVTNLTTNTTTSVVATNAKDNEDLSSTITFDCPALIDDDALGFEILDTCKIVETEDDIIATKDINTVTLLGGEMPSIKVEGPGVETTIEKVVKIPSKYINWDDYANNKKWKWEYHIPAIPFDTQPTIVTGNVSNLQADTFYFIKYTDTAETKFKLTYGDDVFVDNTLEFNRNDAWSDNYEFIHCISVDTASNTAIFGKPYPDDELISCIIPNNTKNLRMKISSRAVNMDIKNSPNPVYSGNGAWGTGVIISADDNPITGNNYGFIGCFTQTDFTKSNNSLTAKEVSLSGAGVGLALNFAMAPACIIDTITTTELAQIKHPRYEGLLQYDANISVADDRRSYSMEGTATGVCWEPINSVSFTNSFDLSSIKATYPIQCYSQLAREDKKLLFKTNEANNKKTKLMISTGDQTLTGFSITVEGEIE